MRRRWFSGKALLLHLALVAAASLCLVAGWWQVNRAMSGNLLSYGYAIEWPVFAVIAGFFWWQLIHEHPKDAEPQRLQPRSAPRGRGTSHNPERRREEETPQLQAYNDDLSALAVRGRPKTWRNPKGLP